MSRHSPFAALLKEDLASRHVPSPYGRWHGWPGLLGSALIWFALLTWLGHDIHFNVNAYWLAAFAVPFIASGTAHRHINQERRGGTIGWWLALPLPRYQLMASQWIASEILAIRSTVYLLIIALLGIYTMWLNGTLSASLVAHFLVHGLVFTVVMDCLIPLGAGLGLLLGVLEQSRLQATLPGVWLLGGALIWLASTYHDLFVVWVHPGVALHPAFIGVILASWALAVLILWLTTVIFERFSTV